MLRRLLRKFFPEDQKYLLPIEAQLAEMRKVSDVLAICPAPTGYAWLGVLTATQSLFGQQTLAIPQYYSQPQLSEKGLRQLASYIGAQKFRIVVLSGFPPYFANFAQLLFDAGARVQVIYHGFPAELADNPTQQASLAQLIALAKKGVIHRIGHVKKSFAECLEVLYGIPAYEIILKNPDPSQVKKLPLDRSKIHIGVLVNNSFRKNLHTQVMAALMVPNAQVHVISDKDLEYLQFSERITAHGSMPHAQFLEVLGTMDINLHVTFSEGSGGQVCSESLALGVPCLSSYNSNFFDHDEELKKMLVVEGFENPLRIYEHILRILAKDEIKSDCVNYTLLQNNYAQDSLSKFIC